ncbi:hypothetical protein IFM61606_06695 [Aspergillus udagawae]|uniref:Uncharacterized protein n=1 Tax=Aspergillus udagawae TaxID=91492 RepID=A0A8H3S934_9EURO|nr:hypothetical protein IFM46972_08619 [Aspergillus udagawae]GFF53571.1 hypothetical protein IFM51744_08142 [Aspergillus udagawae]GFF76593.1 hypothetical protein IFM53868_01875 [Aspergillus udagawae]GFG10494.1 hypothetical protein IFM5058_04953 [Aspergillus udagawae]GFG26700.1 hypothetical protein IFM61606_06695 [Aspergillus udagawae]
MPGVETTGASVNFPESVPERSLFRSCKSLSRRVEVSSDLDLAHAASSNNGGHTSGAVPIATAPALPLTPPSAGHEEASLNDASGMQKTASSHSVNYIHGAMTPTKPSHPPTPETTPPRTTSSTYRPSLSQFGHTSASSRAESFQTAREMISDGETVTPHRSTQSLHHQKKRRPSQQKSSQNESPHGSSDASFGDDRSTPVQSEETLRPTRVDSYDGRDEERAASSDRRPRTRTEKPRDRSVLDGNDEDLPPIRGRKLRDRVKDAQSSMASPSLEQFREEIGWPPAEEESRRNSGVSTSSTIEAMIIDAPRPANRTLRHTEKRQSLRSASSPLTKSERTSLVSNPDSQHRLVHKAARITEHVRKSIASEVSAPASATPGGPPRNIEVVPVVVIPERRSSLQSSQSVSRNPSKAGSRRSSQRPESSRKSRPPSLDLTRQKKRTFSDSIATATPASDPRGRNIGRPVIPPRSSSLSAPTSRDSSRRPSLTSESLQNQGILKDRELDKAPIEHPGPKLDNHTMRAGHWDVTDAPKTQSIWIGVEDMTHLRPPSILFTPASVASSSPGLIEIKEARTVAFFPHNNESLLLVDQPVRAALDPRAPQPDDCQRRRDSRTPENLLSQDPSYVDSPLRNPRPPPKPPVYNIIPPTPKDEADRQLRVADDGVELNGNRPRRFGSLRRGRVVRPRSDSFDRFVRSLSVTSAKNRKAGRDIDSRLHPFWRPRRFWDDSPESEEPPQQAADMESDQIISNSLGMPQPRVVFDGPSLARRSPLQGTNPRRHPQRSGALVGATMFSPEALRSQTSLHQGRILSLTWWRLRLRLGPVRNLRRRLRRSLQQREEAKREARREKLKQKIGEAVLVGSSMQARDLLYRP